jgi:transcription initiation factor TFIID subunit TAF12
MGSGPSLVGGVVGAVGSVMSGRSKKKAAYSEAKQIETEARVRAKNIRKLAAQTRGAARAGYAASGVVVDEGSAVITDMTITRESELDALYTIMGAHNRAKSLRKTGKAEQTAGYINAVRSILSGG